MNVLILHGPNLNLLGEREPAVYGTMTLPELNAKLESRATALGAVLRTFQSNHEGALVDRLHAERHWANGVVINPGALTHYSYVLRDAIAAIRAPTVEVHLTNIEAREPWRRVSVVADVCAARRMGGGVASYVEALEWLVEKHLSPPP